MVKTSAIAATVATTGGSTFQMNMFSAVKTAFDVAVTRLVSMPGMPVGEIARRMAHQMAEQIAPQIAGDADEGVIGDPARDAPEQIIGGDQRAEEAERRPDARHWRRCESVSTRNLTPYCVPTEQATAPEHRSEDDRMR